MRTISVALLTALLLASACSTDADEDQDADRPTTSDDSVAETADEDLLFGAETDTSVVIAAGYGPLVALDLDSGHAQRFPDTNGVPGDFPDRIIPLEDGVAYPGEGGASALPWSLEAPPILLGEASYPVPSGQPHHVWLVHDDPAAPGVPATVLEVDGRGEPAGDPVALPRESFPVGGADDGVLVQTGVFLSLLHPENDQLEGLAEEQHLLDAAGDRIALTAGNPAPTVTVLDLPVEDDGIEVGLDGPASAGVFSPDGRWLAVWGAAPLDADEPDAELTLIDLRTGRAQTIAGSAAGRYGDLTWSNDGQWVFALSRNGGGDADEATYLTAHQLGTEQTIQRTTPSLQAGDLVTIPDAEGPDLKPGGELPDCPASVEGDHNTNPQAAVTADAPCRISTTAEG